MDIILWIIIIVKSNINMKINIRAWFLFRPFVFLALYKFVSISHCLSTVLSRSIVMFDGLIMSSFHKTNQPRSITKNVLLHFFGRFSFFFSVFARFIFLWFCFDSIQLNSLHLEICLRNSMRYEINSTYA